MRKRNSKGQFVKGTIAWNKGLHTQGHLHTKETKNKISQSHIKYNFITKAFLTKEYIKNKKSIKQIARELKCSFVPIKDRLKIFKFKIRTVKESINLLSKLGLFFPNYRHGKCINNKCINCNKKISPYSKRCKTCENQYHSLLIVKNLNPNWRGGISKLPYSFEFNKETKEKIRKRDNYTCQNCGMTEEEHMIIYDKVLNIHHIDYNKKNCNENNLIALCSKCNSKVNFDRDYWYAYFVYIINNKERRDLYGNKFNMSSKLCRPRCIL